MSTTDNDKPSKDFYELCYDQYKIELEEAEKLYQKISVLLILIPVIGGISVSLGRCDLILRISETVVFLYYFSFFMAWCSLSVSTAYSILCVIPRTYKRINDMEGWQDWRKRYQKYIDESGKNETVDDALVREICPKLADAQTKNVPINEKRRKYFQKAVFGASLSIIPIAFQAIFFCLLKIQEIIHV